MSTTKSVAKQRVLQIAEDKNVTVDTAPAPRKQPTTKVLAVRLPTALVDLLLRQKEDNGVELATLVRPVLERAFRNQEIPSTSKPETEPESEEQLYVRNSDGWFSVFVPVTADKPVKPGEQLYKKNINVGWFDDDYVPVTYVPDKGNYEPQTRKPLRAGWF